MSHALAPDQGPERSTNRPASEFSWRSTVRDYAAALGRIAEDDAIAIPLVDATTADSLLEDASRLEWRDAKPVVGPDDRRVRQEFRLTMSFPADSRFRRLTRALEAFTAEALAAMANPPMPPVPFNDMILQDYPVGAAGITPHKDHIKYRYLVAIVVLRGRGRFFICPDRTEEGAREIPSAPGDLLLMRAPGFAGVESRPFHMLKDVTERRFALGLRYDSRAP